MIKRGNIAKQVLVIETWTVRGSGKGISNKYNNLRIENLPLAVLT